MKPKVRPAGRFDAREMAEILNGIIARGDFSAVDAPVTAAGLAQRMQMAPDHSAWHVAEDDSGRILGFQYIETHPGLPPDCCDIASYIRLGEAGLSIGSALFRATESAARALGYGAIVAVIRADNQSGLTYYQSRGFEDWKLWEDAPICPRVMKRYSL